jgi:hypothetical protein
LCGGKSYKISSTGYRCFGEEGEKLYRIWIRVDAGKEHGPFSFEGSLGYG